MLGPILLPATLDPGGLWWERTKKSIAHQQDRRSRGRLFEEKKFHDIFEIVNIYLSEPSLNICFPRRSWSWHEAQDLKRFKVNSKYLKFVPSGHWHELIYDANRRDSDGPDASTWTFTTHQFKYFRILMDGIKNKWSCFCDFIDMQNIIYGVLMVRGRSYCSAKWIKWAFSFAFKTIINQDSIDAERSHPSSSLGLIIYAALSQDCFTLLCKQSGCEIAVPRDQLVWSQEMHQITRKRQQPLTDQLYFPLIKRLVLFLETK